MKFYEQGREKGGFEAGIRLAVQSILMSPRFLFRLEQQPAGIRARATYRIADEDLASRLSFFLWGTVPDAELMQRGQRSARSRPPAGLEKQVRRMLADRKSEALSTRFASQWLRLQDLDKIFPDYLLYPQYDDTLAQAMKRETELFFDSIVREDRSVHGSADGGLLVRQRAAGEALRHPEHHRQRVPARDAAAVSPRPARPGQHPDADVGGRSHLAGAARQVGDGSAAGVAAAGAAAQRAGAR